MVTLFRWLLRGAVVMIAIGFAMVMLAWYFASRSLPDYDATLRLEGISAQVEIVRSTENVPHILAQTDEDAFFGLGLAHAQDRLFQMVMMRRAAEGRLAEIYGPRPLAADDLARRLGLAERARASLDAQDPHSRAALDAYAAGVNAWIGHVNDEALGRGAPEFFILGGEISYWQPADSLALLKLWAATASGAIAEETTLARLSLADAEQGFELIAPLDAPRPPPYAELFPAARLVPHDRDLPAPDWDGQLTGFMAPGLGLGGHLALANGQHSAAGKPLLANDPQNALTAPGLYYLARLSLSSGDAMGATIPGIPAIFSGRRDDLAWGLSPARIDDADLFIEEVQPGNPNRYRGQTGWEEFAKRTEILHQAGGPDLTITLRESRNGPILPPGSFDIAAITPVDHVAALRWTGLSEDDTTLSALLGIMRAPNRAAALAAAGDIVAPAMTLGVADPQGVAARVAGHMPQRSEAQPASGRLPVPGWVNEYAWLGTEPLDETPPTQSGVLGLGALAALSKTEANMPGEALRQFRLDRLLAMRDIHSRDSLIETQLDITSPAARALLPLIGADLWFTGEPAAPGTPERQRQDALALLAEWDGAMGEHLPEPLIYTAWMQALQQRLIRDELGPLAERFRKVQPGFLARVYRDLGGASAWCDIRQSAATEDCTTIARQALDAAIVDLTARFGPDVKSWRWGDVHPAAQPHPALGAMRVIGWIVNIVQPISGGDFTLSDAGIAAQGAAPWRAVRGAGFRGVFDMADPDSSVFVISTGQSGHPLSRHYDDMAELWRRGEYVTMSLDTELARAAATGITVLEPAK